MTAVELTLTETRLWARSSNTHADIPPSVAPGSDGMSLVVGEPLSPQSMACSAVQLLTADRIAYLPSLPSPVDGMTAVFGRLLAELRVPAPCERLIVVTPTEWGTRRRSAIEAAGLRVASEVEFHVAALRAVAADTRNRDRRTVVLEFGPLSTTATSIIYGQQGPEIEACEHEPNLASAEIAPDSPGYSELRGLLERLLPGRPTDSVLVVGGADQGFLELIGSAVAEVSGSDTDLRTIANADLARNKQTEASHYPTAAIPPLPQTEWLQPLRERAAATRPPRSRTPIYIGAAAVAAIVVAGAGAAVVLNQPGDSGKAAAAAQTSTVAEPSSSVAAPTTTAAKATTTKAVPAPRTIGNIRFEAPAGWRITEAAGGSRIYLVPEDGTKVRITLTQKQVVPGVGYDKVAADLEAQIEQRPAGTMSPLQRDVVFGGRSGLAYTEHPDDGSQVDWHVIVEHSTQVAIGCQYQTGGRDTTTQLCADVATTLEVIP
ncbi:type VII secretion-associated protein [Nocardia cyriacigeorgica]|uniref:type VII secretion-associated protein n=1 Tax=Nocardia cyriacigeorgica TaxID=135487 RepID=UPI0018938BE1|nr:type VII secretion-associated protein [Nocardia cyriacigeorgica]MBF6456581.1 type VII secretion-associated protein [Nocardia cyriacigeorgica]MBF6481188.1 type VII secretion-associated protein [Nocardia cyriacigeorgica]MBF6551386.1 type VII secretion-associated protein [Nocardia cyriacigeorgica]